MKFSVHATEAAVQDQIEAAIWYEEREAGLGRAFETEVTDAARRLEGSALHHRLRFGDVRRAPLRRFADYGLYYIVEADVVTIFAMVHGARHPAWVRRRRRYLD